jgi:hypothetical protein
MTFHTKRLDPVPGMPSPQFQSLRQSIRIQPDLEKIFIPIGLLAGQGRQTPFFTCKLPAG